MASVIKKLKTSSHEDWKALRHKYIGGSDAAAIVGLNPHKSAYSLWAEKTDRLPPFEGNMATKVGTFLEEFVAKLFEEETGKKVRRENHSLINDKFPFAIANVDRVLIGEDAGLEIKTTNALNMKRFKNGEFPTEYYCQCMHYMAVTEKPKWYLAVLIGNSDFKIFEIDRDEQEIEALMQAEAEFWGKVKSDVPPAADGSEATTEAIKNIYSSSNDKQIDLTMIDDKINLYINACAQIKELEGIKTEAENNIKAFMGESEKGIGNLATVTWKTQTRSTFDRKAYEKENGIIPQIFFKQSTSRPFILKINE